MKRDRKAERPKVQRDERGDLGAWSDIILTDRQKQEVARRAAADAHREAERLRAEAERELERAQATVAERERRNVPPLAEPSPHAATFPEWLKSHVPHATERPATEHGEWRIRWHVTRRGGEYVPGRYESVHVYAMDAQTLYRALVRAGVDYVAQERLYDDGNAILLSEHARKPDDDGPARSADPVDWERAA